MTAPLAYAVVGSGWRGEFFVRMARLMPDRFRCTGVVTRSDERAEWVRRTWGVPALRSLDEIDGVDVVVVATPWPVTPVTIRALVDREIPVLAETPPAPDADGLVTLWHHVGSTELVQVAEHSVFMPAHAAREAVVDSGLIGEPTSVQVSSTHLYHAMGLVRRLLRVAPGPAVVRASAFTAPLLDPRNRDGWTGAEWPVGARTVLATVDLGENRSALYDFTDNQWHNPLRANRIVVRGSLGEIVDDAVIRWAGDRTVVTSPIVRRQSGIEQNLDGWDTEHLSLDGQVLWRNLFEGARLADDDLAVAGLLAATAQWVRGTGPAPYPLAEGCQDHLLGLAIEESARTGEPVQVPAAPWATA